MIKATKQLKEYLRLSGLSNKEFAARIDFDEPTTSQVLNRKEEPSKTFIEAVITHTGMKFEAAFEITDRREEDK